MVQTGAVQNFVEIGQKLIEVDIIAYILPTHIVYPSKTCGPHGLTRRCKKIRPNWFGNSRLVNFGRKTWDLRPLTTTCSRATASDYVHFSGHRVSRSA